MKIQLLTTLFVGTLLFCGCSTTKFTSYDGSEIFQGKGGTVHNVDGIDFWEDGEPDRKYQILGVIEKSPKHHIPLGSISRLIPESGDRESAIAKAAHKQGGDAVILVPKNPEPSTDEDQPAQGRHGNHQRFTIVVVKYVK